MATHTATASYEIGGRGRKIQGAFGRVFGAIGLFFAELSKASDAAAAYERLAALSDEALARRGITREDLPRHAFESVYGQRG